MVSHPPARHRGPGLRARQDDRGHRPDGGAGRRDCGCPGTRSGPDYIDPGYHALATGRPGRNLDPVLVGEELIAPLFLHGAAGADVAVVEGVMGLFDGGPTGGGDDLIRLHRPRRPAAGRAGRARRRRRAPGRSVAALVHGFAAASTRGPSWPA